MWVILSPNASAAHLPTLKASGGSLPFVYIVYIPISAFTTPSHFLNNGILTISAWVLCRNFIELGINKIYYVTHFILHKCFMHHWRHLQHLLSLGIWQNELSHTWPNSPIFGENCIRHGPKAPKFSATWCTHWDSEVQNIKSVYRNFCR